MVQRFPGSEPVHFLDSVGRGKPRRIFTTARISSVAEDDDNAASRPPAGRLFYSYVPGSTVYPPTSRHASAT